MEETNGVTRFTLRVSPDCEAQLMRAMGPAAALCLREAVGGARILWPGEIERDGEIVAAVTCRVSGGAAELDFELRGGDDPEVVRERVEPALAALAADYPENNPQIIQDYCNACGTLMKYVDTAYRGMPVYGFAFAVDKYGGLMVMTQATRSVVTVYSGRAELAKDEPQQPDYPVMPRV